MPNARMRRAGIAVCFLISHLQVEGMAAEADKNGFNLFNPTPHTLMREFSTDRPGTTDTPFTIDAGHVQFESDLVNYTKSRPDEVGTITETFLFAATNVRIGITNNAELSFVLQPFNAVRTRMIDPPRSEWKAGPDTLGIFAKFNLVGNDTFKGPGAIALALMPFVSIPTVRDGVGEEHVEGGLMVPFAIKLTDKADLGLMTAVQMIKNTEGSGYHAEYVNSASLSYDWTSQVSTYGEVATRLGTEGPFGGVVTLGGGFLFKLTDNTQLDIGANVGLTRAADRVNAFVGLSRRF